MDNNKDSDPEFFQAPVPKPEIIGDVIETSLYFDDSLSSSENSETLSKAYTFALNAHKNQKRDSGDPYLTHPIAVADILTDLKLGHQVEMYQAVGKQEIK